VKEIPDEIELIRRLQKGDVDAFDMIYTKYSGKLYAFGVKYLRSTAESEELVQSVFLKLWENQKSLRIDTSFKSFLFTIAYNDICKLFRKRNYHQQFIKETLYENSQTSFSMEESVEYKSVLARVEKIINILPKRQKEIFLKSRMEGKSTKEIADEIGLSPGTVDNYISESLRFIRSRLKNESLSVLLFFSLFFL
jgi:RNA polymerase sigma-70 factor (family 1)